MTISKHEEIIVDFIKKNPLWKRYKLRQEIINAFLLDYEVEKQDDSPKDQIETINWIKKDKVPLINYIPDAFYVDADEKTVHLLEVDGSSGTCEKKLQRIDDLWLYLDDESWCLTLTTISVHTKAISYLSDQDFVNLHYSKYGDRKEFIQSFYYSSNFINEDYCPKPQINF